MFNLITILAFTVSYICGCSPRMRLLEEMVQQERSHGSTKVIQKSSIWSPEEGRIVFQEDDGHCIYKAVLDRDGCVIQAQFQLVPLHEGEPVPSFRLITPNPAGPLVEVLNAIHVRLSNPEYRDFYDLKEDFHRLICSIAPERDSLVGVKDSEAGLIFTYIQEALALEIILPREICFMQAFVNRLSEVFGAIDTLKGRFLAVILGTSRTADGSVSQIMASNFAYVIIREFLAATYYSTKGVREIPSVPVFSQVSLPS